MPSINDNFADAIEVTIETDGGTYTSAALSNVGNTFEVDEPDSSGSSARSMWFSYTPSTSGTATFDTQLTTAIDSTDSIIAIWTGTALNNLVNVATDDDGGGSGTSRVPDLAVTGGTTYWIQCAGYGNAHMNMVLRVVGQSTTGGGGGTDGNVIAVSATATGEVLPPVITGESVISGGGPATGSAVAHAPNVTGGASGDGQVTAVPATATAEAGIPNISDGTYVGSKRDELMDDLVTAGFAVGSVSDRIHALLLDEFGYQSSISDYIVNEGGKAPVLSKNILQ